MPVSALLGFWAVAALLILVPGPDWAFALSAGLRGHVAAAATGIVLGYLAMTIVVAAGVGVLIAASPVALSVLTVIGGGYLVRLGVVTLLRPAGPAGVAERICPTAGSTVVRGIGVSGLNPKALLLFVTMLPQFTTAAFPWPVAGQMAALGLEFTVTCAVVYLVVGACAQRMLHARPRTARAVSWLSGSCMIVIGVALPVGHLLG